MIAMLPWYPLRSFLTEVCSPLLPPPHDQHPRGSSKVHLVYTDDGIQKDIGQRFFYILLTKKSKPLRENLEQFKLIA